MLAIGYWERGALLYLVLSTFTFTSVGEVAGSFVSLGWPAKVYSALVDYKGAKIYPATRKLLAAFWLPAIRPIGIHKKGEREREGRAHSGRMR